MEVEINNQWYTADDFYSSKKQAEQAAARKALEMIEQTDGESVSMPSAVVQITSDDLEPPPSYSEAVKSVAIEHLPPEYAHIERYISIMVQSFGGRVRKMWSPDSNGFFKFEIAGAYRFCDRIQGHHRGGTIYFMVDPINQIYYQMCHYPQCSGFRSIARRITIQQRAPINEKESTDL